MQETVCHDVSGTAFVVNYSRARMAGISRDRFAHLWVTKESIVLWKELAQKVYPNDDLNLSLRNRFYLDCQQAFLLEHQNRHPVMVNIASGFTSYPFLISSRDCTYFEYDLPNIMAFKKETVIRWMQEKRLPSRSVRYLPVDLLEPGQRNLMKKELETAISDRPSFILLEGITYYLDPAALQDLLTMLREFQVRGSRIALDFWRPDAMSYPVMLRLKKYFDSKFGERKTGWHLYNDRVIRGISDYRVHESTDIAALEVRYSPTRLFQGRDNKIPVNFIVLERR